MKPQLSFERFLFVWRRHCRFYRGFCLGMSFLLVDKNSAQLQIGAMLRTIFLAKRAFNELLVNFRIKLLGLLTVKQVASAQNGKM